jgi:hypothetical protein
MAWGLPAVEMMTLVEPVSDIPLYHRHAERLGFLVPRPSRRDDRAAQAFMAPFLIMN